MTIANRLFDKIIIVPIFLLLLLLFVIIMTDSKEGNTGTAINLLAVDENIPVGNLVPGKLKRAPDYPSELEGKTLSEIKEIARGSGELAQKAKKIKKIVEQQKRLKEFY